MMTQSKRLAIVVVTASLAAFSGIVITQMNGLYGVGNMGAIFFAVMTPFMFLVQGNRTAIKTDAGIRFLFIASIALVIGSVSASLVRLSFGSREDAIGDIGGIGAWVLSTGLLLVCVSMAYGKVTWRSNGALSQ